MKRTLTLLLSGLLALSLTACGENKNDNPVNHGSASVTDNANGALDGGAGSGAVTDNNIAPGDGVNNGTGSASGVLPGDNGLGLEHNGTGAPNDPLTGTNNTNGTTSAVPQSSIRGATYGQMLRNARVHDRDGNLHDGENAVTPGTRY